MVFPELDFRRARLVRIVLDAEQRTHRLLIQPLGEVGVPATALDVLQVVNKQVSKAGVGCLVVTTHAHLAVVEDVW